MKAARLLLFCTIFITLGVGFVTLSSAPQTLPAVMQGPVLQPTADLDALERARRSVFDIVLVDYERSGSAVLIGRQRLEDGQYLYRAVTNYHVIDDILDALDEKGSEASRKVSLTFQPTFHGDPVQFVVDADPNWAMPAWDWASFTFVSPHWLECADVSARTDFEKIKPFEHIYVVACGGRFGQQLREGVISVTHNLATEDQENKYPWQRNPRDYFRLSTPIWYGDSGGAVFNKDGKLIGLPTAFTTIRTKVDDPMPVFHHGVALKAHVIREQVSKSPDFFKVEK